MNAEQVQSSIHPADLSSLLQREPGLELIDVRTPAEFASGHVPGAKSIPLSELDPKAYAQKRAAAGRPIYVLCESGARAAKAVTLFQNAGCGDCVLVAGGTQAWRAAGLPVDRTGKEVLPLMRQVQITVGALSATGAILALTVHPYFALIPLVLGGGLLFAGLSGWCGLALLLARMPWNQSAACGTGSGQAKG